MLQTETSLTEWGAALQGRSVGGIWSFQERKWHINDLEPLALKLALQTFFKSQNFSSIHIKMDILMTKSKTRNLNIVGI